mgnify:FL=1
MLHPLFKLWIEKVDTTEKPQTHETEKDYRVLKPKTKQQGPKTDEHASSFSITKTGFPCGFSDNSKVLTTS